VNWSRPGAHNGVEAGRPRPAGRIDPAADYPVDMPPIQAPTGTRDLYPAELNRLRFIQDAWRRASISHGFDEIDGPTFEHLDLYTIKSGEGIVSELFSFERFGGEKKFALRPEFTPTLARLFAAKAGSLPKPTKWFWMQNCFRAERPQRGRLREFYQWNCDVIGDDSAQADAEVIACAVGMFESLGLTAAHLRVRLNDRRVISALLAQCGATDDVAALNLLDRRSKLERGEFEKAAAGLGLRLAEFEAGCQRLIAESEAFKAGKPAGEGALLGLGQLWPLLAQMGVAAWCDFDPGIARGLAYYTGMVFEVHEASGAERAVAGGGRYDKLIELFGGPPTPAVGFGMGDVVLSLVLQDKGLMPGDDQIADRLGLRPDLFVIAAENRENPEVTRAADDAVAPLLAAARRAGLHVRKSYKSTRNIGKLLGDATKMRARYALIVETGLTGQIKDLEKGEQIGIEINKVVEWVKQQVKK